MGGAAYDGHVEVFKYLIEVQGMDPSERDTNGRTPLALSAEDGTLDILQYVVEGGIPFSDQEARLFTHVVASSGNLSLLRHLVEQKGVDCEARQEETGSPVLCCAIEHMEMVRYLVEEVGVDLEARDGKARTALDVARLRGRDQVPEFLEAKVGHCAPGGCGLPNFRLLRRNCSHQVTKPPASKASVNACLRRLGGWGRCGPLP